MDTIMNFFKTLPFYEKSIMRQSYQEQAPLPAKKNILYRLLRHPFLMPYNRWATLIFLLNIYFFDKNSLTISPQSIADIVLLNFSIAILIRQQYVVNFLFLVATSIPISWPLWIRWAAGKVYHFGGIHVGCYFSGTLWLAFLTFSLYSESQRLFLICFIHSLILFSIIFSSIPSIRARYHNTFEVMARFGNWISLGFFWTLFILMEEVENASLFENPRFWILGLITFSIALPWLRLRKIDVKITTPSNHVALSEFNYGVTPFAGSSTELSVNPLLEWHSFANVPSPGKEGFRLTISRAGDWTGRLIEEKRQRLWVKGIPTAGVGNIEKLFKKVLWVATGSGIGPCLPHLLSNEVPSKLVWSTRTPGNTYGKELCDEIMQACPDAVIWDTTKSGKPDLTLLTYQAFVDSGAEAIICISNKNVTWKIVNEMETRGIPAFGAIWDS